MNLTTILRTIFLPIASLWLAIAGIIVPVLFEHGAHTAMAHVLILAGISLWAIFLNKPAKK